MVLEAIDIERLAQVGGSELLFSAECQYKFTMSLLQIVPKIVFRKPWVELVGGRQRQPRDLKKTLRGNRSLVDSKERERSNSYAIEGAKD